MRFNNKGNIDFNFEVSKHENVYFCGYINKNNTIASSNDDYIRIDRKTKKKKEKLEKALENKIESIEKEKEKIKEKERKMQLKELEKTEVLELDDIKKTGIIPTISYKEFVNEKRTKEKKESFISSFIKRIKKNREKRKKENEILGKSTISKEERNTLLLTKREEEKKRKLELKEKAREEKLARIKEKELKKEEAKRKLTELKEQKKQEIENKKAEELRLREDKKREKEREKILSDNSTSNNRSLTKEERDLEKKRIKEEKEKIKHEKEERKKEELRRKYEEKAREKQEKDEKKLNLLREKQEKNKKIKKEKEQARRERKEKALLIKKAEEESKEKEKKERKTLQEKVKDWYNNLSFVKDRQNRREMQRQTLLIDFEGADAIRSEEKIMYKYVAKNLETGKVEKGYFAAFSKLDVHSFLIAEGYEVYEITPQKTLVKGLTLFAPKFNAKDLDFFLTQLSTFLKSGITLVDSVKILSKQTKKTGQKQVYKSIIYELTMGDNFSEALAKQGNIFPRLLINMIKTSELTGDLPETLDDMADYYRETEKTKKQMMSALTYPIVVLTFAISVLIFIMVKVIPEFVSIYGGLNADLPKITVIIISISNFLQTYWPYLIIGIFGFILVFAILFRTIKVFRTVIQSLLMNMPIFGKIIIYNEVTMFTKTFASLLNHNVYITDCMEVLSKITNNEVYKMLIFDTITNLAKGEAISNSFKNHWAFPTIAYEMILTGEKTGQLGSMMDKVANYYQDQHNNAVNQIKAFIEPVLIVILAAIVGVVLLSVVLPMFDMYQNIG